MGSTDGTTSARRLIATIVAAYMLTKTQRKALALAIYAARVNAYTAAYRGAARAMGAVLAGAWEPADDALRTQRDAAAAAAAAVSATYARDLTRQVTSFVRQWLTNEAHAGSLDGASHALASDLSGWTNGRATWKAEQIARHETAQARADGTTDAGSDAQDGTLTDSDGNPIDPSQQLVAVMPPSSSSDFCFEYAGMVWPLDDAPSIDFPAHAGCIHSWVYLGPADTDVQLYP